MKKDKNGRRWSKSLVEDIVYKINDRKIVPVVGSGVYYVMDKDGRRCEVREFVVRELLRNNQEDLQIESEKEDVGKFLQGGFKGMTRLNKLFKQHNIDMRTSLRRLFHDEQVRKRIRMDEQVQKFLRKGNFPLVLTTCYFKGLEKLITYDEQTFGAVSYEKEQKASQDIPMNETTGELTEPTIFHLFGVMGSSPKNYVVTENDFLNFLHYLQDTNHYPRRLKEYLQSRYILTLGCEIPDWTFRFLLYSLKESNGELQTDGAMNSFEGGAVTERMDEDLEEFLEDIKYFSDDKMGEFLCDINQMLTPQKKPKLFLSMSQKDYELGAAIKSELEHEFEVWFFPDDKAPQYWKCIQEGVEKCDYFMPVVTGRLLMMLYQKKITEEERRDDEPGIVTEWRMALRHWQSANQTHLYCIPYLIDINENELKDALDARCPFLKPLFVTQEGVQCVMGPVERLLKDDTLKAIYDTPMDSE